MKEKKNMLVVRTFVELIIIVFSLSFVIVLLLCGFLKGFFSFLLD